MNSKRSWVLEIDSDIHKYLPKIPSSDAQKILEAIELFVSNPFSGDIEKIKKEKYLWRRRIGSYRIFYEIYSVGKLVKVLWVERRTSKTYSKR